MMPSRKNDSESTIIPQLPSLKQHSPVTQPKTVKQAIEQQIYSSHEGVSIKSKPTTPIAQEKR